MTMNLLLALAACATPPTATTRAPAAEATPARVVMISIDTARPDDLGWFGGEAATPRIDGLLDDALVLTRHHSCASWTYPSSVCALTGSSMLDLGQLPVDEEGLNMVPGQTPTLPAILGGAGWRAGLVTSNPLIGDGTGLGEGYDLLTVHNTGSGVVITDAALAMADTLEAEGADGEPWLLHAHYFDPHTPYNPPSAYLGALDGLEPVPYDLGVTSEYHDVKVALDSGLPEDEEALLIAHLRARYLASMAYLDDQIGRLLDELDAAGLLEDTAIVLWTDHGEQFMEHGAWGHAHTLHYGENRALAAFIAPGLTPGRLDAPTIHQDITPAVLDLVGVARPAGLGGGLEAASEDRALLLTRLPVEGPRLGLVQGGLKLLYSQPIDGEPETALYDESADAYELEDLAAAEPALAADLFEIMAPSLEQILSLYEGSW